MKTRSAGLTLLFLVPLASSTVRAAGPEVDLDWSVNSRVTQTDNATLANANPINDIIGSAGGSIDLSRSGSRLNARLLGDGSYRTYLDGTYEDEFLGSAATSIRLALAGEAFTWTLADTFGQSVTNSVAPSTPDNRGDVNVFATGPNLAVRLGTATEVALQVRYENSSYEESSRLDSRSWTADAAIVRRVSPAVAWSIHAVPKRIDYNDTDTPDYDQNDAFLRLEANTSDQGLTADVGVAFLRLNGQTEQEPVIRLKWTRRLTTSLNLQLYGGSGFRNSSEQFVAGVGEGTELGGTQDVILVDQAHRYDTADASLSFQRSRTAARLYGSVSRERFPDAPGVDRDTWSLGAEASRRLTPRMQATLTLNHENRDFSALPEDDQTTDIALALDWRIGRVVVLGIQGRTEKRSGDTTSDYDQTILQASITYRPLGN